MSMRSKRGRTTRARNQTPRNKLQSVKKAANDRLPAHRLWERHKRCGTQSYITTRTVQAKGKTGAATVL